MPRLVVEPVTSANAVRRALLPGQADEHGTFDGEVLTVETDDDAEMLVETYPNVRWADTDSGAGEPDTDDLATCEAVKSDGEVCGRELPCRYHD